MSKTDHKKPASECSDRDLLIRIDERTQGLAEWKTKVTVSLVTISVVLVFILAQTYPMVISALAH